MGARDHVWVVEGVYGLTFIRNEDGEFLWKSSDLGFVCFAEDTIASAAFCVRCKVTLVDGFGGPCSATTERKACPLCNSVHD